MHMGCLRNYGVLEWLGVWYVQTSVRRETGRDLFIMERLIHPAKEFKLYPESHGEPVENFKRGQGGLSSS